MATADVAYIILLKSPQPTFLSGLGAYTFPGFCLAADSGKVFIMHKVPLRGNNI